MTREEALEVMKAYKDAVKIEAFDVAIKALEEPSGEWISELVDGEDWKGCKRQYYQPISCSKCHSPSFYKSTYCPNCGAKMVEPQE